MVEAELCNRCGGKPIKRKITSDKNNTTYWIECSNNKAHNSTPCDFEQDAVACWNRQYGALSGKGYKQYRSITGTVFKTGRAWEQNGYGVFLKFLDEGRWQQQTTLFKKSYGSQDEAQNALDSAAIKAKWKEVTNK